MSEQRGLRNPDTHGTTSDGEPYCESCGVCDEGWRCRCCLAAEVEALRARNETLIGMVERDTAAIQRVRDVTVPVPGDVYDLDSYTRGAADALALTNKALDGDA